MQQIKLIAENGWDMQVANGGLYFRKNSSCNQTDEYYLYDLQQVYKVNKNEFLTAKLGTNFRQIIETFGSEPTSAIILNDGSVIATEYKDFYIHIFDSKGNLTRKIEDIGFDSIYDIAFEAPDFLWCAMPTANAIRKYRLSDSKEVFGIGDYGDNSKLSLPEAVTVYKQYLYISDTNHKRICRLDLQTYQQEVFFQFDEEIWEFKAINNLPFFRTEKAIYQLTE